MARPVPDLASLAAATAANPQGVPEIVIYEHGHFNANQEGWEFRTNLNYLNLGSLNDKASSCIVVSGTWELFNNTHYDPAAGKWTLGPGYYPVFDGGATPLNDSLTSFRSL